MILVYGKYEKTIFSTFFFFCDYYFLKNDADAEVGKNIFVALCINERLGVMTQRKALRKMPNQDTALSKDNKSLMCVAVTCFILYLLIYSYKLYFI